MVRMREPHSVDIKCLTNEYVEQENTDDDIQQVETGAKEVGECVSGANARCQPFCGLPSVTKPFLFLFDEVSDPFDHPRPLVGVCIGSTFCDSFCDCLHLTLLQV